MKNKKIIILIIIIMFAPLLILASALTGKFSGSTGKLMGVIEIAIYIFAMIYSVWFIRSKKNK